MLRSFVSVFFQANVATHRKKSQFFWKGMQIVSYITVGHQIRPLHITHFLQLSNEEVKMIQTCNQMNVPNAVCAKIIRSNDKELEFYQEYTTCQGCFPSVCLKPTIGWASILWTRHNSGIYDYRIPFCKSCKEAVMQRAKTYTQEYQHACVSPLHHVAS